MLDGADDGAKDVDGADDGADDVDGADDGADDVDGADDGNTGRLKKDKCNDEMTLSF